MTWPEHDGPAVICRLRNQIIHPKDVASLMALDSEATHGVLRLATWYVELALLRLLGYSGEHLNQTRALPLFDGRGEPVPWSKSAG